MDNFMDYFPPRELFVFNTFDSTNPLDYVNPCRKHDLEKILGNVPDSVELMIVYGSSIADYVLHSSDLDLAIISPDRKCYTSSFFQKLMLDCEVDFHIFYSFEDLVEQAIGYFPTPRAILLEGVLVYVRGMEVKVLCQELI